MRTQPDRFEFDERLLLSISRHAFSCRFGNFLADSEHERSRILIRERTVSLWSLINSHREQYTNKSFASARLTVSHEDWLDSIFVGGKLEISYWSNHHEEMNNLENIGSMHKEVTGSAFSDSVYLSVAKNLLVCVCTLHYSHTLVCSLAVSLSFGQLWTGKLFMIGAHIYGDFRSCHDYLRVQAVEVRTMGFL